MPANILIVDDSPTDRLIIQRALRELDVTVDTAPDAESAMALMQEKEYALLLLDVHLPGMRGDQLAERLRHDERTQFIPIIFLTGETNPLQLQEYEAGAVDCLLKPVDPAVLRSKVRLFAELEQQKKIIQAQVQALKRQTAQLESAVRDREQAEEALQESEVRYRTLLELSPVATIVQVNDEMVYVNTAVLGLVGGDEREQFLGKSILTFFNTSSVEEGRGYVDQLVQQGGRLPAIEAEWIRNDGGLVSVQLAGACILYGGDVGVQFAALDISDRKRVERELHELSRRDGLTRTHNRRAFDEVLDRECRRARRSGLPLALVLLDVDQFKAYNDTYGHPAGDEVLKQVAAAMEQEAQRAADCVARYGGEEFALILPETTLRGAKTVAERVRAGVEALNISHGSSAVAPCVTVSIGVVQAPPETMPAPETLIDAADKALYQAKHGGRNQVRALQF